MRQFWKRIQLSANGIICSNAIIIFTCRRATHTRIGNTQTNGVRMNERHALMLINKNVFAKRTKVENYCTELGVLNSLDTWLRTTHGQLRVIFGFYFHDPKSVFDKCVDDGNNCTFFTLIWSLKWNRRTAFLQWRLQCTKQFENSQKLTLLINAQTHSPDNVFM